MQIATIAGNIGKDAELKSTQSGDQFCRFSVAVTTGWGDRKATTWWDVTRWGKGAEKLAPMLTRGTKVTVVGEVSTREHEGKTYLQLRADHVTLQGGGHGSSDTRQASDSYSAGATTHRNQDGFGSGWSGYGFGGGRSGYGFGGGRSGFGGDLDDEVPF